MKLKLVSIILLTSAILSGCNYELIPDKDDEDILFQDNQSLYIDDNILEIKEVYITVLPPDPRDLDTNFTLSDVNLDLTFNDEYDPSVKVLVQEGRDGEIKPGDYGFGLIDYNGILSIRGHSTRTYPQKSYKISLLKGTNPFYGNETLNLNKHPFDVTRFRNRLGFKMLENIDNTLSVRTMFVRLFVRDYSASSDASFEDYGLYTNVEQLNANYLKVRGLDSKGELYKAENFEFKRHKDILLNTDDINYDKDAFEDILEIKGRENHEDLIEMLEGINSTFYDIDDLIEEYFDRDNYVTWLASNILLDNIDTTTQNFYLYSPRESEKFYFIFWDLDGGIGHYKDPEVDLRRPSWRIGVSNYWNVSLHKRFFKKEKNIEEVRAKMYELSDVINGENLQSFADTFRELTYPFITNPPDSLSYVKSLDDYESDVNYFKDIPDTSMRLFEESIKHPMPFFLREPSSFNGRLVFHWESSYDLENRPINYDFTISSTPDMQNIVYEKTDLFEPGVIVENLPSGDYYWTVVSRNSDGYIQNPFDFYKSREGKTYLGIQRLVWNNDIQ
ncbi:MAG: CotH kinase family protein [Acidaminobacteraceae bacterium]